MKADFAGRWAESPATQRREPTGAELGGGFPCGDLDQKLFNELVYRLTQNYGETINLLLKSGLAPSASDLLQVTKSIQNGKINLAVATGTNALVASLDPSPDTLTDGLPVLVYCPSNNTGAVTFKLNAFSAAPLVRTDGQPLQVDDIVGPTLLPIARYGGSWRSLRLMKSELSIESFQGLGRAIAGLVPTNFSGNASSAQINISAGSCADSTGSLAKKFTGGVWSVSDANAYQGGTVLPNSSTIHMFAIWGVSGTAFFGSTSATNPTLPSGYTAFRRIFSFRTDSAGAPVPYTAVEVEGGGFRATLASPALDLSNYQIKLPTSPSSGLVTMSVPTGISVEWQGSAVLVQTAGPPATQCYIYLRGPDEPYSTYIAAQPQQNPIPDAFVSDQGAAGGAEFGSPRRFTDTAGRLRAYANQTWSGLYLTTTGWIDLRRS